MTTTEGGPAHLFIVRIWTDAGLASPGIARVLIEDARTHDRRYFRDLAKMAAFISSQVSAPGPTGRTTDES